MEAKIKHLEMIQGIINRMSGNLFFLKGWSISLITALFVLSAKDSNQAYMYMSYFPVIIFWVLDGYFLSHERAFRDLYDDVRKQENSEIDFSMNVKKYQSKYKNTWHGAILSQTLVLFYMCLIGVMLLLMYLINN